MNISKILGLSSLHKKIVDAINKPLTPIITDDYDRQNNSQRDSQSIEVNDSQTYDFHDSQSGVKENVIENLSIKKDESQSESQSDVQQSNNKKITRRQKKIITLVKRDKNISAKRISVLLGVSVPTVYRDMKVIGIHWVGSPKTGFWSFESELK